MTIENLIEKIQGIGDQTDKFDGFFEYLVESEDQVLALIEYVERPKNLPPPVVPKGGSLEVGFVLYWIHSPPTEVETWLTEHQVINELFKLLLSLAPPTKITTQEYTKLSNKICEFAVPWDDGTLYGFKTYEQLDPGWLLAAINYALNLVDPDLIHSPLPVPNTRSIPCLTSKQNESSSIDPIIGIIGDWGTGFFTEDGIISPAQRVVEDLKTRKIDYLFHLGDVYYAGTDWRPFPEEELSNLVNIWPDQGENRNLTLNSNHEMYGGAQGFFDVAMQSDLFKWQAGTSFFARKYGDWLILCLDSAYYSDAENGDKWYMDGAIGTKTKTVQIDWLKQFQGHEGPIMIMSHHNPCDTFTATINILFQQVKSALGKSPDLWYWGHVHNAIVYNQLRSDNLDSQIKTKGRCCGHAAIPFGNGWGLEDKANIPYYAHTKDPLYPSDSPRVLNGYATVQLHSQGGFTEKFYEVGISEPIWHKTWATSQSEDSQR